MPVSVKPLAFKPPRLDGLSERLLASHYENNYGGALRRLNAIQKRLAEIDLATAPVFEINGLKREELIAAGSVILHEIYFDGIGGAGEPNGDLAGALERDFGSVGKWKSDFTASAKAQAGGSGWMLLTWSDRLGRLVNQWAADHAHNLADGRPVFALDMYEHAYHLDFGAKAAAYVDTFMKNVHWERVGERFAAVAGRGPSMSKSPEGAAQVSPEELKAMLDRGDDVVVLDICLKDDMAKRVDMLPGAAIKPPETLAVWAEELSRGKPIVAYCVYGFQVSGDAVAELRRRGFDARSLSGGIAAWHAIGGPTTPLAPR
jgi:Fe-Mn family superoxide dismutase